MIFSSLDRPGTPKTLDTIQRTIGKQKVPKCNLRTGTVWPSPCSPAPDQLGTGNLVPAAVRSGRRTRLGMSAPVPPYAKAGADVYTFALSDAISVVQATEAAEAAAFIASQKIFRLFDTAPRPSPAGSCLRSRPRPRPRPRQLSRVRPRPHPRCRCRPRRRAVRSRRGWEAWYWR